MKTMKKVFSVLLVLAMILSLGAMAVSAAPTDGSVTVTDPQKGETYKLYKLFDLSYDQPNNPTKFAYTYTKNGETDTFLTALQGTDSPFTLTQTTTANVYNVALKDQKTSVDVVKFLKANEAALHNPTEKIAGEEAQLVFDNLDHGYYYLTSTSGTLVTLNSNTPNVNVEDKNEAPTLTKQVQEDSTGVWGESNTASVGETVKFKITIAAKKGAKNYVVHDTLPAGMTYNSDLKIEAYPETMYTVNVDGQKITVTFNESFLQNLQQEETQVTINYSATMNHDAVIGGAGNVNTAYMTYGASGRTVDATTTTYTYGFDLVKTDADNKLLAGATFKLYDAPEGGNEVKLVKQAAGYHPVVGQEASNEVIDMTKNAKVRIEGLDNGTYYLEEVQAPAGYNKLTSRVKVTIQDANQDATLNDLDDTYVSGGVQVVNQAGSQLPSTGGMGTTMFYVLGAVLVLGAAVLLIAKRRVREQ